ncbi:uncharacterized protein L203_103164 [Cryptococcus depauperatus CBS 7841]|uniref:Uncharacterized protein n=1 Tax=Cryptococcus depauperatus CBS 7841 TaxID=1295531 RepID=A0AAJ8JT31_9TREE
MEGNLPLCGGLSSGADLAVQDGHPNSSQALQNYDVSAISNLSVPEARLAPKKTQSIGNMTVEDIERRQRSHNRPPAHDLYNIARVQFPIPGEQPTHAYNNRTPFSGYNLSDNSVSATPAQGSPKPRDPVSSHLPTQQRCHSLQPEMDSVSSFLAEMPTEADDPTRHVLWAELIRLKTRSLELQIAEARRREKEAELELARLQSGMASKGGNGGTSGAAAPSTSATTSLSVNAMTEHASDYDMSQQQAAQQTFTSFPQMSIGAPTVTASYNAVSPFELDAILQSDSTNFLSWLPDFGSGDGSANGLQAGSSNTISVDFTSNPVDVPTEASNLAESSLTRQTSRSPSNSPPPKRVKRSTKKKSVIEQSCSCTMCSKSLARVMIRAPKSQIPHPVSISLRCQQCAPVKQPSALLDQSSSAAGISIGTVETRKRLRVSMEIDDEEARVMERRTWCDVCQRIVGSGLIVGGRDREVILHMTELVCSSCDSKYQRCTDCGGGGGSRIGIGKWRMKQVFHPGRKTCSLSHTRLGHRTRELGVHVTPTDLTPEQMKEVLSRCKALWNEKTLSRLAIPEMLEVDLPPNLANPLRDFNDVNDIVTRNWPSREAMIRADGIDQTRFKRLISLIWAHSKPRRSVRTVDLEEEWSKQADENDKEDMSTVLDNVKRTNVVIPAGSELVGMWGGEWDMHHGSLLISTFIPFEGTDGEDSTALSVGEMITKVQGLLLKINNERTKLAKKQGKEPNFLPPCEHLWTVSGGYIPLVRERIADVLIRKRAFVHVEEYLTRHPEFIECIKTRPVGLHPDIHRPIPQNKEDDQNEPRPLILVRWLGKDFNAQKMLEIKQMEFGGGKQKVKKRPRTKT